MSIPITTVLKIRPIEGLEKVCLEWVRGTGEVVSKFDGYEGRELYRSLDDSHTFVSVFTFDSKDSLERWESSVERKRRMDKGKEFIDYLIEKKRFVGLEVLFANSLEVSADKSPVRWKMMVSMIVIIFSLINTLDIVVIWFLKLIDIPEFLHSLVNVTAMVALMTYVLIPALMKYLGTWLREP